LVVYLIYDLEAAHTGVETFVHRLEEVMIRTVRDWEIRAARSSLNPGIWVGRRKIGSIGIAIRRGITYHGLALNVNLSLEPFGWINPCGLNGVEMTSMQVETRSGMVLEDVRATLKGHFQAVFETRLEPLAMDALPESIRRQSGLSGT
jgi:lipoate-protein ligase B